MGRINSLRLMVPMPMKRGMSLMWDEWTWGRVWERKGAVDKRDSWIGAKARSGMSA